MPDPFETDRIKCWGPQVTKSIFLGLYEELFLEEDK